MRNDDQIYQAFLEELQQLDKFRATHFTLFAETPLETEDPYTKRLIEALAFFGARARLNGIQRVTDIHQRLFRQYFPYLVNPLPTFGMIQIKPSIRFPEKVVLPAGSELFFKTSTQFKAAFQTLDALTVFPLFLKKFQFEQRQNGGRRCVIEYHSIHVSTDEIGSFKLYINHLNSFFSSLRAAFAIMRCLEKVQVFYDSPLLVEGQGIDCPVQFGFEANERLVFHHEIEQIRSLLHFPQQELFIAFQAPAYRKRWQTLSICLDFDDKWPEMLSLNADSLVPFVVPIINLKKAPADPIICDGMKESYPILYPEPLHQFELHTLISVSELLLSGAHLIQPGILGKGGGSYEVDYFKQELLLDLPDAFENPKTVAVQALWTQPRFREYINDSLELQFSEAQTFGLSLSLLGPFYPYEQTIEEDPNFLIRILSLKNQTHLNLNELLFILKAMKNLDNSFFDNVKDWIRELKINQKRGEKNTNTIIEYEFYLKDWGGQRWEIVVLFFKYVNSLLNCWLPNFEIETKVHFPQSKKQLLIKEGKEYELSALARNFFLSL